jgi:hypothetical protein
VSPDGAAKPFCEADPDGRNLAIPYPTPGIGQGFAITCSSGAVGKCFRFGYRPWTGAQLAHLHAACVRMVRADYSGDDNPWTRNGMQIDIYEDMHTQTSTDDPAQAFEAGRNENGAVCVAHVRVKENGSLDDIAAKEPRFAGKLGPVACTEVSARTLGAVGGGADNEAAQFGPRGVEEACIRPRRK